MTFHIHIRGQVQGVGFRPYVFRLAEQFLLRGWVNNASDGVHIEFTTDEAIAFDFYEKLLLLRERLNTATARRMAEERHTFLAEFVERFLGEWNS